MKPWRKLGPGPVVLAALCLTAPALAGDAAGQVPLFEKDVLPLLEAKCVRCHGDKAKKAELDLRTRAGILKGGESGPVVAPGKPADSRLFEMVESSRMPPGKNPKLTPAEVETVRRWIETGAHFADD